MRLKMKDPQPCGNNLLPSGYQTLATTTLPASWYWNKCQPIGFHQQYVMLNLLAQSLLDCSWRGMPLAIIDASINRSSYWDESSYLMLAESIYQTTLSFTHGHETKLLGSPIAEEHQSLWCHSKECILK